MAWYTKRQVKDLGHGDIFGPYSRFQLWRHESDRGPEYSCWMVLDAETPDPVTGYAGVIRQEQTIEAAVKGLPLDGAHEV